MRQNKQSVTGGTLPSPFVSGDDSVESVLRSLAEWAADQRVDAAAASRIRERWLRQQAVESATLAGIAVDLAESGARVSIRTVAGRSHHGRVDAVGRDFLVLRSTSARPTFLAMAAVAWLRPEPGTMGDGTGDRGAPVDVSLADVLLRMSGDRPHLQVTVGDETVTGQLRAVSADVLTVRTDGDPPATVHIRLGSIYEVSPLGSG